MPPTQPAGTDSPRSPTGVTASALATYPYLASTRAELLRRTGNWTDAVAAYEEALVFTSNAVEAAFLTRRMN